MALPSPATGGTILTDSGYYIHKFTSNGSFVPASSGKIEILVLGGGGGGGNSDDTINSNEVALTAL